MFKRPLAANAGGTRSYSIKYLVQLNTWRGSCQPLPSIF
jgi:hypothetical protein